MSAFGIASDQRPARLEFPMSASAATEAPRPRVVSFRCAGVALERAPCKPVRQGCDFDAGAPLQIPDAVDRVADWRLLLYHCLASALDPSKPVRQGCDCAVEAPVQTPGAVDWRLSIYHWLASALEPPKPV